MPRSRRICVITPKDGELQDHAEFTPAGFEFDFGLTRLPAGDLTISLLLRMAADK